MQTGGPLLVGGWAASLRQGAQQKPTAPRRRLTQAREHETIDPVDACIPGEEPAE
jgi:hypothetical protein